MEEWISHYLSEGVDHFFLIDNGSTDEPYGVLHKFKEKVTVFHDPKKNSQAELYNNYCLPLCKNFVWTLVCDLDEFMYSKNGFGTIAEYLKRVPESVAQVSVPWKVFGSSGRNSASLPDSEKQPELIVPNFTRRANYDKLQNLHGVMWKTANGESVKFSFNKSIVRTRALQAFDIHGHVLYQNTGKTVSSYLGKTGAEKRFFDASYGFSLVSEYVLKNSALNLNHYAIQSLDWFMRVKATRGDGCSADADNVRDLSYFQSFDENSDDEDTLNAEDIF